MAATITSIASGTSTTTDTEVVTGATVTASVGDWLIVIAASSNDGSNGFPSMITPIDSGGVNTYSTRSRINYDPGAAGAGATCGIFSCAVTSALSNATITGRHDANTDQKAIQVYRVQPGAGETITSIAVDSAGITGNATEHAAAAIAVTSGDIIFGAAAIETDDAVTGDTDTTNGSWSTVVTRLADGGADAATMSSVSQYKTVTGTGDQTWSCTTASGRDSARAYYVIRSAVASADFALSKTLGTLTASSTATVDTNDASLAKTLGTLTASSTAAVDTNDAALSKTLGALTLSAVAEVANATAEFSLSQTLAPLTSSANANADIGASLSKPLAALTSSSAATVDIDASLAKTLAAVTSSSAATVDTDASLAQTLGALTSSATIGVNTDADLSKTLGALTSSATATVAIDAALTKTLGALTSSATATIDLNADLAKTLGALTASAATTVDIEAALSKTLGAVTSSSAVTVAIDAALAKNLGNLTLSATVLAESQGDVNLSRTLDALTASATATVDIQAGLTKTLGDLSVAAAASLAIGVDLSKALAALTVSSTVTVDTNDAALSVTLGSLTVSSQIGDEAIFSVGVTLGALISAGAIQLVTPRVATGGTISSPRRSMLRNNVQGVVSRNNVQQTVTRT